MYHPKTSNIISKSRIILFIILFGVGVNAQIPLGIWEGNFGYLDIMVQPQKIILELYEQNDSSITGVTHLYYSNNKYEHYKVKVTFNTIDSTYLISEDSILSVKLIFGVKRSAGTYKMKIDCKDSLCTLIGSWKTHSRVFFKYRTVFASFTQKINKLSSIRQSSSDDSSSRGNDIVLKRHSDIQSLIELDRSLDDTVQIEIYDNGYIDNDSISLYLDDMQVVSKQMISTSPILFYIPSQKINSISRLKLVAESLGSISPCTALMVIKTNNKRYEVTLSSNFKKNAVVEFFLRE